MENPRAMNTYRLQYIRKHVKILNSTSNFAAQALVIINDMKNYRFNKCYGGYVTINIQQSPDLPFPFAVSKETC